MKEKKLLIKYLMIKYKNIKKVIKSQKLKYERIIH